MIKKYCFGNGKRIVYIYMSFKTIFLNIFKQHIILLITLLCSFFYTQCYAQKHTNFNINNGLPSNHVYKIVQDYDGYIWMITENGMVKYNGTNFKTFTTKNGLPTNEIWDIRVGHDNKIWYFTKANKLGYIKNDVVYSFKSELTNEILYPKSINQNKNEIRFYDRKKEYRVVNGKWKPNVIFAKNGHEEHVIHDKVDYIFTNLQKKLLQVYDKEGLVLSSYKTKYASEKGHYKGQVNDSLFCWVSDNVMCFLNLNTLKYIEKRAVIQPRKYIRFSTANNNIQFSGENFVGYLSDQYALKKIIEIPKKLKSHFSFIDKNKNIWIATFDDGVYFLPYSKQKAKYLLQNKKVRKLQKVNGEVIASVYRKGFYKYNKISKKFTPFYEIDNYIYDANYIEELDINYYITDCTILQVNNKGALKNKKSIIRKNPNSERSLVYLNGYLYANTSYGVNKINPKSHKTLQKYKQKGILSIMKYKHKILVATVSGLKVLKTDSIVTLREDSEFKNKPIVSISKFNRNQLIVCTKGFGAYITDFNKTELLELSNYLNVHAAFVDNNDIWLATDKGVWHYKKIDNKFKYINNYTINDGLNSNNISSVIINDGEILASSNEGVSIIPVLKVKNNQFINIDIDAIVYNNSSIKNKKIKYSIGGQLQVTIETIDFSEDQNNSFSYQLKPIQNQWVTSTSNKITFANLPPNDYQLSIKSGDKSKSAFFCITPLWYQTIFFKIALSILGLLFLFFIIKRYQNKIKRKAQIQQQLAEQELYALRSQMNPHFVFNSLSAIQYYINQNNFKASEEYLVLFSSLIRQFFELSKQKNIVLKEEVQLLNNYLEIEKLRFKDKLSYVITVDDKLNRNTIKIPTMLLQPVVENAVNHGIFNKKENGTVIIKFTYIDKKTYQVSVIDDGVGMLNTVRNLPKKKNSSAVLKDRLRYLNQNKKWKIIYNKIPLHPNREDKGTNITFTITKI